MHQVSQEAGTNNACSDCGDPEDSQIGLKLSTSVKEQSGTKFVLTVLPRQRWQKVVGSEEKKKTTIEHQTDCNAEDRSEVSALV
jgi:hypothetical protein